MKPFEFAHKYKKWDEYGAFHNTQGPFVEFETGELMLPSHGHKPYDRKMYERFGLRLTTTTEPDCPDLYFDRECYHPVKKAWLTQKGQQILVIDYQQGVAVKSDYGWRNKNENAKCFASHVQHAGILWTGSDVLPIPRAPIHISRPDQYLRHDIGSKLKEVATIVTAAARVRGLTTYWDSGLDAKKEWVDMSADDICANVLSSDNDMARVAKNGFSFPRTNDAAEYLFVYNTK